MVGSAQRAVITESGIMDVLRGLVTKAETIVNQAVGEQIENRRDALREQADADERWKPPSDAIKTWEDDDGNAAFGVPGDTEHAEQAQAAEYGTGDTPPTALIRMGVVSQVSDISWALTDRFRNEGL